MARNLSERVGTGLLDSKMGFLKSKKSAAEIARCARNFSSG
jgi:hypothetical protein